MTVRVGGLADVGVAVRVDRGVSVAVGVVVRVGVTDVNGVRVTVDLGVEVGVEVGVGVGGTTHTSSEKYLSDDTLLSTKPIAYPVSLVNE